MPEAEATSAVLDPNVDEPDETTGGPRPRFAGYDVREIFTLSGWRDPAFRGTVVPLVGLVAMIVYFGFESPGFATSNNFFAILRDGAGLLIIATGATWVILMGSIDLSVGSVAVLSGLISATLMQNHGVAFSVTLAVLAGLGAGVMNGILFAYGKLPSFLVTLGTSLAIGGIGLELTGGASVQVFDQGFLNISQAQFIPGVPNIALWSIVIWVAAIAVGIWTRFGRYAYAIGGGEVVARLSGVAVRRFKFYAFVVSATLAGISGVLTTSLLGSGSPAYTATSGDIVLLSVAAVVMGGTALTGGVGGVHRTMIGALVLSILGNGLSGMSVQPFKQSIIQGVVVILAVALTIDRSKLTVLK